MFQLSVKIFDDLKPAIDSTIASMKEFIESLSEGWEWLVKNKEEVISLGAGIGTLAAGVLAYNVYLAAMGLETAYVTAAIFFETLAVGTLAEALMAAGITGATAWALMTGGLSLVVVAIVELWQHSETFRNGINMLAVDAKIAGNALLAMWDIATGDVTGYQETSNRISELLAQREALMAGRGEGSITVAGATKEEAYSPFLDGHKPGSSKMAPKREKTKSELDSATDTAKAAPNKVVSINITIGNLVNSLEIKTTNMTESASKIQEAVAKALTGAVRNSQIIAG
jgi:hypothetical protein